MEAVYSNVGNDYQHFVVWMVLAIGMQRMSTQWAGLADSFYLAAMNYLEKVVSHKNLKTLQCLVLIAQYSLLTPTRTAIYYIVGLQTRLCQQLGLTEEKYIAQTHGNNETNAIVLDMRRRLSWIVLSMEFGLAQSLGRPNGFATGQDHVDVGFFAPFEDKDIKADGISPDAKFSNRKLVAIHFFKMRLLQAEIRRVLYQKKRDQPCDDSEPWFIEMEQKLDSWCDESPQFDTFSKPWWVFKHICSQWIR